MNAIATIFNLALHHSMVVQFVLLFLLILSLASWTFIFQKWSRLRAAKRELTGLHQRLHSHTSLAGLSQDLNSARKGITAALASGLDKIIDLKRLSGMDESTTLDQARQTWETAVWREIRTLGSNLPFLATVGSLSPYIGLFGTVIGIISVFGALGDAHELSLTSIAPGIAESLVATAAGLLAAIPAIFAHNRFVTDVEGLADEYLEIVDELGFRLLTDTQPAGSNGLREESS